MLTADLVHARRRKGDELRARRRSTPRRARAPRELAATLPRARRSHVGRDPRGARRGVRRGRGRQRHASASSPPACASWSRTAASFDAERGDRARGAAPRGLPARDAARRAPRRGATFDRAAVLARGRRARAGSPPRRSSARSTPTCAAPTCCAASTPIAPRRPGRRYDLAQAQAVLLRAVRVTVEVECAARRRATARCSAS